MSCTQYTRRGPGCDNSIIRRDGGCNGRRAHPADEAVPPADDGCREEQGPEIAQGADRRGAFRTRGKRGGGRRSRQSLPLVRLPALREEGARRARPPAVPLPRVRQDLHRRHHAHLLHHQARQVGLDEVRGVPRGHAPAARVGGKVRRVPQDGVLHAPQAARGHGQAHARLPRGGRRRGRARRVLLQGELQGKPLQVGVRHAQEAPHKVARNRRAREDMRAHRHQRRRRHLLRDRGEGRPRRGGSQGAARRQARGRRDNLDGPCARVPPRPARPRRRRAHRQQEGGARHQQGEQPPLPDEALHRQVPGCLHETPRELPRLVQVDMVLQGPQERGRARRAHSEAGGPRHVREDLAPVQGDPLSVLRVLDQAGEMGLACAEGHIRRGVMSRAVWRSASAASAEVVPRCK